MAQNVVEGAIGAIASSLLAPVLLGPMSKVEVLGAASDLLWLAIDGQAITIQPIRTDPELALPTSIFLPGLLPDATEIEIRDGELQIRQNPLAITRWWQPPKVHPAPWKNGFGPTPEPERLLGLGLGLTPEGDDLLAGWLVAARAIEHPQFAVMYAEILTLSTTRTTLFSSALLKYAGAGYGVRPLVDYVNALLSDPSASAKCRDGLTRVGHTSGRALAHGVDMATGRNENTEHFSDLKFEERASA